MELLYVEEHVDRSAAMVRERFLKSLEGSRVKRRIIEELTDDRIAETQQKYS